MEIAFDLILYMFIITGIYFLFFDGTPKS